MAAISKADQANFDSLVLKSNKTVLVDFWAEWCGPCKALSPILEEVAKEMGEKAIVVKVNVDENAELSQKYGIRGIPTMIFFKNGEIKNTLVGNQPKAEIVKTINSLN